MKPNCYLHALSSHVPAEVLTNDDLSKLVETNDEWITTRTGIKRRHRLSGEENASDLGTHAARYARKYKHLLVPASYVDSDGVRLGVWISNLRAARKNRPDSYQVTPAHIKKLNSIGMVWDARDAKWGTAYQQAKAYYKAHGNLHAAANYKSDETGFCLGDWLRRMREWDTTHDPKLTSERRAMLDKIGMEWSE